jgi:hypothetical protein
MLNQFAAQVVLVEREPSDVFRSIVWLALPDGRTGGKIGVDAKVRVQPGRPRLHRPAGAVRTP